MPIEVKETLPWRNLPVHYMGQMRFLPPIVSIGGMQRTCVFASEFGAVERPVMPQNEKKRKEIEVTYVKGSYAVLFITGEKAHSQSINNAI